MNRNIERIITKATTTLVSPTHFSLGDEEAPMVKSFKLNLFIKLLLSEMVEEIASVSVGDYVSDEWDKGYEAGLQQAMDCIEIHFGPINE
jgi:hypothetical protein